MAKMLDAIKIYESAESGNTASDGTAIPNVTDFPPLLQYYATLLRISRHTTKLESLQCFFERLDFLSLHFVEKAITDEDITRRHLAIGRPGVVA